MNQNGFAAVLVTLIFLNVWLTAGDPDILDGITHFLMK